MIQATESSTQSDFLQTIDKALGCRHEIAAHLKLIRQAGESLGYRKEIGSFQKTVQSDIDAKEIVEDGNMAMWVPAIIDYSRSTGDTQTRLAILTAVIARNADLRQSNAKSWNYVLVLGMTLIIVFTSLCAYVIPFYAEMFEEFQLGLPWITTALLAVSAWVGPKAKAIIMIVFGTWAMIAIGKRMRKRLAREHVLVRSWGILGTGHNSRVIAMSRLLNTLGSLVEIGTPIPEALTIAGRASLSEMYVQHAVALSEILRVHGGIHAGENETFPTLMLEALRTDGFTKGDRQMMSDLFRELSTIYSERVKHRSEIVVQLLLPLAVLLLGGTVGLIVIALMMPLFQLVGGLGGSSILKVFGF
jgi:type II secretory pathway component PulF